MPYLDSPLQNLDNIARQYWSTLNGTVFFLLAIDGADQQDFAFPGPIIIAAGLGDGADDHHAGNIGKLARLTNLTQNIKWPEGLYLAYPVNADTHYMLGAPNRRSRVQRRSAPQPRPRSPAMI